MKGLRRRPGQSPLRRSLLRLGAAGAALALTACASPLGLSGPGLSGPGLTGTGAATVTSTRVDRAIAQISPEIARYCSAIEGLLFIGETFASGKTRTVFSSAGRAFDQFCLAPPTNVASALDTLRRSYLSVVALSPGVPK